MENYTELIIGAKLKNDTPTQVIESLRFVTGMSEEKPDGFVFNDDDAEKFGYLLNDSVVDFSTTIITHKAIHFNTNSNTWEINTRTKSNNYKYTVMFLNWLKPYVKSGSIVKTDLYALVINQGMPSMYYK